jgi:hypothetical protein
MNNQFNDQFLLDYNFNNNPKKSTLVQNAEARERNWYIMLKRLKGIDKYTDPNGKSRALNTTNMNSAPPTNWQNDLKVMLLSGKQQVMNISQDNNVIQITDKQVDQIWQKLMQCYSNIQVMKDLGLHLLQQEIKTKTFHNNKTSTGTMSPAMLNGLKTEFAQMLKRTEWAHQWNVNVASNTVALKQTYDLTFKGKERERALKASGVKDVAINFMKDIPFEVKTQLSRFHVLGIHDQFTTHNTLTIEDIEVTQDGNGQNTATVYIDSKKLTTLIDSYLYSKLEATPVYESPATLLLPSELFKAFEEANKLKIFVDTAALMGARVEDMELIDKNEKTEIKYHLWYGR